MDTKKIIRWIASIEGSSEEEKVIWEALDEDLKEIMKPIRQKLLEDQETVIELTQQSDQLLAEVNFYKEAIRTLPNPIFIKDSETRFLFFNDKYKNLFGLEGNTYIGNKVGDLEHLPVETRAKYQNEDEIMIRDSSVIHYEMPFESVDGDIHETLYWSKGFFVEETGEKGLIGEIVDISKEKELQRELEANIELLERANESITVFSKTDILTGLYNRCVLSDSFELMVAVYKEHQEKFSVLLVDIDHFKPINDIYGHLVGDDVLRKFASILKQNTREDDICLRYGGEEFLVFLPNTDLKEAEEIAEKLCEEIRHCPILPNGENITVSIGVTQYRAKEKLETLVRRADNAMYQAKESGRDQVGTLWIDEA